MTEAVESSIAASTPATDEASKAAASSSEDKTTEISGSAKEETPPAGESSAKGTEEEGTSTNTSSGEKRKADDHSKADPSTEKTATATAPAPAQTKPKKAKIAMPPSVSSSVLNVEKYKLESPPPENNTNAADVTKKITTANLMLFGLHPLVKANPLQKMLEDYGTVQAITVRSAFASRYGHVSFANVEEARRCYVAIHGAKLLHKSFLVQPSMAAVKPEPAADAGTTKTDDKSPAAEVSDSAGAAAAAAAMTTIASG